MQYKVTLSAPINGYERNFYLDLCTTRSITDSVRVAEHPVQDGSVVADHMFREPTRIQLSGSFGINGSATIDGTDCYTLDYIRGNDYTDDEWAEFIQGDGKELGLITDDRRERLANIQTIFAWLQKNGILCKAAMLGESGGPVNFRVREHNLIESVTWTPQLNSMVFSMTLREIILVKTDTADVDETNSDLYDSLKYPSIKSLGEVLVGDTGDVIKTVLNYMIDYGYISIEDGQVFIKVGKDSPLGVETGFGAYMSGAPGAFGTGVIAGLGTFIAILKDVLPVILSIKNIAVLTAVGGGVAAGAAGAAAGSLTVPGAGWIVAAVCLAVAVTATTIVSVKSVKENKEKRKRLEKGFNLIYNYEKYLDENGDIKESLISAAEINNIDIARLKKLIDEITNSVKNLTTGVTAYQITSDPTDNESRIFPIMVGNDFMYIGIDVTDVSDTPFTIRLFTYDENGDEELIAGQINTWSAITDINQCTRDQVLYIDSSFEYELYLVAPGLEASNKPRLSDYYFLTVKGNMADNVRKITNRVAEILQNEGYTE